MATLAGTGPELVRVPRSLRIRVLGEFAVELAGTPVPRAEIGSRKARTLLRLLAAAPGRLVPMDRLVELLWRGRPPIDGAANVATLVSRLRGTLGAEIIAGGRGGYRLVTGTTVVVDLDEAETLVAEAEVRLASDHPALAVVAANAALVGMNRGAVFQDEPDADWDGQVGREAERLVRRAHVTGWRAATAIGDHRQALAFAADAVAADPLDEEAQRAVMGSYHRLGEPGEALAAYRRLCTVLVEELGASPGPETERVYMAVLRGDAIDDAEHDLARPVVEREPGVIGRDPEMAVLIEHWSKAVRGSAGCVLVVGEAGIGKSHLMCGLAHRVGAGGAAVFHVRCYEAERSLFMQPVVDVLRQCVARIDPRLLRDVIGDWVGPLGELVPEIHRLMGPVAYRSAPAEFERRRAFAAASEFLAALARQRPVLVVLEDLHLAGASTIELVHFLLRWEPATPLLVVGTVRAEEGDEVLGQLGALATSIELGPFSVAAVEVLAGEIGLTARAAEVFAVTRGHPLFVVEALRSIADSESEQLSVPASLETAVATRLRRCGTDVEQMLRAASVSGLTLHMEEVADLLDVTEEEVVGLAERALRARLLVETGSSYEFSNELIRSVLYATTPAPTRLARRRRLARRAQSTDESAMHALEAGDGAMASTGG